MFPIRNRRLIYLSVHSSNIYHPSIQHPFNHLSLCQPFHYYHISISLHWPSTHSFIHPSSIHYSSLVHSPSNHLSLCHPFINHPSIYQFTYPSSMNPSIHQQLNHPTIQLFMLFICQSSIHKSTHPSIQCQAQGVVLGSGDGSCPHNSSVISNTIITCLSWPGKLRGFGNPRRGISAHIHDQRLSIEHLHRILSEHIHQNNFRSIGRTWEAIHTWSSTRQTDSPNPAQIRERWHVKDPYLRVSVAVIKRHD